MAYMEQVSASNLIDTNPLPDVVSTHWVNTPWTHHAAETRVKSFTCPSTNTYATPDFVAAELGMYVNSQGLAGMIAYGWSNASFGNGYVLTFGRTNYLGTGGYLGNIPDRNVSAANAQRLGVPSPATSITYEGVFGARTKTRFANITDGTSNTFLFGEATGGRTDRRLNMAFTWVGAGPLPMYLGLTADGQPGRNWWFFNSEHPGIVHFAFADGSVRKISPNISYANFINFGGMHDGRDVTFDAAQ